jgi:hypothetical protein
VRRTTILLILLGVAALLAGCGAHPAPPSATPTDRRTPDRAAVVPWAALPPTRPSIPFRVVPARPDSAIAARARHCTAADLALHWPGPGGAAGTMIDNVEVDLAPGHPPCAVAGVPTLTAWTVEGATIPGRITASTVHARGPVLLTPRRHALVQLSWPSACFSDHPGSSSLSLGYAGRTWTRAVPDLSDVCHFEPDRRLQSVDVSRFVPAHVRPARRVSAYDDVRLHARRRLTARPGRPIDFVVTLVARRRVVLGPCPDYQLGASPGRGSRFALNCADVPWRDAAGTPYLPAGRPVRFAMHLAGLYGSEQKLWWRIVAPGSPPFLAGVVRIR